MNSVASEKGLSTREMDVTSRVENYGPSPTVQVLSAPSPRDL